MKLLFQNNDGKWVSTGNAEGIKKFEVAIIDHVNVEFERNGTGKVELEALNDVLENVKFDSLYKFLSVKGRLSFDLVGGHSESVDAIGIGTEQTPYRVTDNSKLYFFRSDDCNNIIKIKVGDKKFDVCSLYAASRERNKGLVFFKTRDGDYWCNIEDLAVNWNESIENNINSKIEGAVDMVQVTSLNTIFYGPPGTGKTYSLKGAVARLFEKEPEDYANFKALMDAFPRQIEFLTFHQSYSYEDFIEGITAKTNNEGGIEYVIKNGVFKVLCRRAYAYKKLAENGLSEEDINGYADAIEHYAKSTDEQLNESNDDIAVLKNLLNGSATDTPEQAKAEQATAARKFVICIDEINRGNISKIFGELITLIEDTKRYGADDVISATLAGSGDQLHVPDNLYIIGTMNTADRSIAKLDVALRRRFDFVPMYPVANLIKHRKSKEFLERLNDAIFEKNSSHELAVGHAFFMSVRGDKDFWRVLKAKVIPLLEEYFLEDRQRVCEVLQKALDCHDVNFDARTFSYSIDGNPL